jgi:CheY-like chemotaxis protein
MGLRARVLVVEDDRDIREIVADALHSAGYGVDVADNGVVALQRLREHPIDAIVLDLMMPVMDGIEFLARRRCDPAIAGIPVIVMTAQHLPTVTDVVAILRKPFALDELLAVMARGVRESGIYSR